MTLDLSQYLENIRSDARLDQSDETIIMSELEAHIEDKVKELTDAGMPQTEAIKECLNQMGNVKSISREIYEAYSQGSWKHVILASLPHFLFGLLFVLDWWHQPAWLFVVIIAVIATTLYGWSHGKPFWIFPWMGYILVPVCIGGLMLLYLPPGWSFLSVLVYIPLAIWWFFHVIISTIKRDWLFSSLMLLPMPIIIGWYLAVSPSGGFSEDTLKQLYQFSPWIGLSFMGLAATIAVFLRLRQRWLRITLLAISGLVTLCLIAYHSTGNVNNLAFLGLLFGLWGGLLIPPILERRFKHRPAK